MKLCVRQNAFSTEQPFWVTDEYGNEKYLVEGKQVGLVVEMRVLSKSGELLSTIKEDLMRFTPTYRIEVEGKEGLRLSKSFWSTKPYFRIADLGIEVSGNFHDYNYCASADERTIFTVDKKWFSWGDCYMIEMPDGISEMLALSVVIAIYCEGEKRENAG